MDFAKRKQFPISGGVVAEMSRYDVRFENSEIQIAQ